MRAPEFVYVFSDDSLLLVGDIARRTTVREGVLEKIVERRTDSYTFYDNDKPRNPHYEQWTRLRITFDDSDEPEDFLFPTHIYYPLRAMQRPVRVRYTLESTDYVSQRKLDLYEALPLGFGTYDDEIPSEWDEQWNSLDQDMLCDDNGLLAIESDRTVKRTFEMLTEEGDVSQAYSHTTFRWDAARWMSASIVIPDEE